MQLLYVLMWVAVIYCAGGLLVALVVTLIPTNQVSFDDQDSSQRMLQVFVAWPVVVGHMTIVAITAMTRNLRVRR